MLVHTDTILEVDELGKLYSRSSTSLRRRLMNDFLRLFFYQRPRIPKTLNSGDFWSLQDINFTLKRGEALGIIGFNGAGKTTLLRILAGQILPDKGEIRILGNTAAMIDLTAGFSGSATGRQNIFLRGAMLGRDREEMEACVDEIISFSELGDAIDAPFSTYSSGMKMRLAFSVMIASEPDILFIDEILSVGDFRFQQKCLAKIREIRERVAFVLVSHSMANIRLFCTQAIVLHQGNLIFTGEPDEAIDIYEEMKFPEATSQEEKTSEILKPQYHNPESISGMQHFWCDKDGKRVENVKSGEDLYFHLSFDITYAPRNLIIGVPMWNEAGTYITGFSTELQTQKYTAKPGQRAEFILYVPNLPLNPGNYVSNIAVSDGLEFLFRSANPPLTIEKSRKRYWGIATLEHSWAQKNI